MATPKRIKYPRTPHLPWSPGRTGDDILLESIQHLEKLKDVVVTEKLDGENTTLYHDYLHARSIDSASHASRNWLKRFHAEMSYKIPLDMRICGENLFAKHSIFYNALTSYFYVFAIFQDDACLTWDETVEWCRRLELEPMPTLYRGKWDEQKIRACWRGVSFYGEEQEGYVVRNATCFSYADFKYNVAKYVRASHVRTTQNWKRGSIISNQLE
ncbi:RNA ligase family protein [candidate division KSB1 bacterium]|nr:RNA ligase family protein [candidate division KSB1 bacterium]